MLRAVIRMSAAAAGAVVALAALAVPAAADGYVPDGCVGSVAYACTGSALPPPTPWPTRLNSYASVPVTITAPSIRVVPSTTVGGQQVGGVMVVAGGQTIPGAAHTVGGPTDPVATGFVVPVNVCVFVTCVLAGTPIVVPGVPAPVVPVVIPATHVPAQPVSVPVVGTVPTVTAPEVATPPVGTHVVTVGIYMQRDELWWAAYRMCSSGGGSYGSLTVGDTVFDRCDGGSTAVPATALFVLWDATYRVP